MSRYRALCLGFAVVLLAAPMAFAHKDKDKESKKEPKKEAPAKQSTPAPQPKSHSGHEHTPATSNDSQHSSHSSTETSSTNTSTTSHDHGDKHHPQESTQSPTVNETPNNQWHGHRDPATHSTHDAVHSSTSSSHQGHPHYQEVDHARLHERLAVRPGTVERQHSYERARVEREQFRRHVDPIRFVPAHRVVLTHIRIVPTTYHYRRTVFYDTYAWQPPVYVYGFYPRYGLWDATFLAFALDHIAEEQYALMFYHHQHEAELQQWMDDADRLAADNEDLRAKLDAMKAQMSTMNDSGVTADPSYVPPDAQDVALSPEVITQLTSK